MTWQSDLSAALEARDLVEQFAKPIINKYARLADRTAMLPSTERADLPVDEPTREDVARQIGRDPERQAQELAEAQKQRASLETQLSRLNTELGHLRSKSSVDSQRIGDLTADKRVSTIRLKDLEEEIKGKAKLLENVHDETVALTLQLNILEEKNQGLRKENEDLVQRWMVRMGQEAEAMNEASRFH